MEKALYIEDIRKKVGYTQIDWAEKIGTSFRTYSGRLNGSQPDWKLDEVVKAAEYNDGLIIVNTASGKLKLTIERID